jgi:hypothetical protein
MMCSSDFHRIPCKLGAALAMCHPAAENVQSVHWMSHKHTSYETTALALVCDLQKYHRRSYESLKSDSCHGTFVAPLGSSPYC